MALPLGIPIAALGLLLGGWGLLLRRLRALEALPEAAETALMDSICLCIPARNEAAELGRALDSWLAQDAPNVKIVVVDDASTDATPDLLAVRASVHPSRLAVLRSEALPEGWLGKNHALHLASEHPWAREADWLLFVDADVRAETDLLRRVRSYLEGHDTDVLALFPGLDAVTWAERLCVPAGSLLVLLAMNPGAVADPCSRAACGIGAFTLIRRSLYDRIGGHAAAPMVAIDDMALALRAKRAGGRNRLAQGGPALRLRMYRGASDLLQGMRKNVLGFPGAAWAAPLLLILPSLLTLSPLWLAIGGWPGTGFLVWLFFPAMVGTLHQRVSARPSDLVWALWPLLGPLISLGVLVALGDLLRGLNVWRGRAVPVGRP